MDEILGWEILNLEICCKGENVSNVQARRMSDNFGDTFTS
jgi:hypothetical protein